MSGTGFGYTGNHPGLGLPSHLPSVYPFQFLLQLRQPIGAQRLAEIKTLSSGYNHPLGSNAILVPGRLRYLHILLDWPFLLKMKGLDSKQQ